MVDKRFNYHVISIELEHLYSELIVGASITKLD